MKKNGRLFLDYALAALGISLEQLADRMAFKSLGRVYRGDIPLSPSKRKHIDSIMELEAARRGVVPKPRAELLREAAIKREAAKQLFEIACRAEREAIELERRA